MNQSFNPIFAPVVAGMVATGDHHLAAATYARLSQWMLWILFPAIALFALAGPTILLIYPSAFQQGSLWLTLLAVACAINAFVSLGETAIMVQKPHWNLLHSGVTCVASAAVYYFLIPRFGVTGAAFGSLVPFTILGLLRSATLRVLFQWSYPWKNFLPPSFAAIAALIPALLCRTLLAGIVGQILSAATFLGVFGIVWKYRSALECLTTDRPTNL